MRALAWLLASKPWRIASAETNSMARAKPATGRARAGARRCSSPPCTRRREHAGGDQQEADRAVRRHRRGTADARESISPNM
jgi:hypothetical protein